MYDKKIAKYVMKEATDKVGSLKANGINDVMHNYRSHDVLSS